MITGDSGIHDEDSVTSTWDQVIGTATVKEDFKGKRGRKVMMRLPSRGRPKKLDSNFDPTVIDEHVKNYEQEKQDKRIDISSHKTKDWKMICDLMKRHNGSLKEKTKYRYKTFKIYEKYLQDINN